MKKIISKIFAVALVIVSVGLFSSCDKSTCKCETFSVEIAGQKYQGKSEDVPVPESGKCSDMDITIAGTQIMKCR